MSSITSGARVCALVVFVDRRERAAQAVSCCGAASTASPAHYLGQGALGVTFTFCERETVCCSRGRAGRWRTRTSDCKHERCIRLGLACPDS